MPATQYGNFHDFCRDSGSKWATIPVCNLFNESPSGKFAASGASGFGGCDLLGIHLGGDQVLANLGSILLDGAGILIALLLIFLSDRKRAAVGRREMQLFLFGFLVISICEIFTIGGFPLNSAVKRAFTAIHIAAVVSTAWILLLNAVVGFQLLEDGTPLSMGLVFGSSIVLFIGSGYIALDTGFSWTHYWDSTLVAPNRAYALYTIYLLLPLVFIAIFFVLEGVLVVGVLGERRPLIYLAAAAVLFALGQIFQFVVSVHICNGTHNKINGGLFETLFTLLAVGMIWVFWSSITEDDWPTGAPVSDDLDSRGNPRLSSLERLGNFNKSDNVLWRRDHQYPLQARLGGDWRQRQVALGVNSRTAEQSNNMPSSVSSPPRANRRSLVIPFPKFNPNVTATTEDYELDNINEAKEDDKPEEDTKEKRRSLTEMLWWKSGASKKQSTTSLGQDSAVTTTSRRSKFSEDLDGEGGWPDDIGRAM